MKSRDMGPELRFAEPTRYFFAQHRSLMGVGMKITSVEKMTLRALAGNDQNQLAPLGSGIRDKAQKGRFGGVPGHPVQIEARFRR